MLTAPLASGASGMAAASARVQAIRTRLESLSPSPAPTRFSLDAQLAATSTAAGPGPGGVAVAPGSPAAAPAVGAPTAGAGAPVSAPAVGQAGPQLPASGGGALRPATFAHLGRGRVDAAPVAPGVAAPGALAAKLPPAAQRWVPAIEAAAASAGLDPALLAALVRHESNFDQGVVSHAGAIGLAQLMPGTARGLGVDPHDPIENLTGGARYLRAQLDRFGSVELALAAYNAGPNRVVSSGGIPPIAETQAYVRRVTATWEQLR